MRRSRFGEEQIIAILREQEAGAATGEVCRRHGISDAIFYNPAAPIARRGIALRFLTAALFRTRLSGAGRNVSSYCPMSWIGGACSGGFPRLIVS